MTTIVGQERNTGGYARPAGIALLDALLGDGRRIFTTEDARTTADTLGMQQRALPGLLHSLAASGWVRRLRNGLYAVDETRRGGPAPHPFAIATALVQPSAISHWSALAYHGLTEQVPRLVTASTPKDVVTPRMRAGHSAGNPASVWEIDGLAIRYFRVHSARFWGFDDVWVDEFSRVLVTDRERTILDGFLAPEVFGSIAEIMGALEEHLTEVDIPRLVAYTLRYGQAATTKRLGYVLETLCVAADLVRPLRDAPVSGYRLLDPQGLNEGRYAAPWRLRLNLANR
ncbi:MAG TPA: type IV toxin-antitoxin system AbiEi family antitoxin domain-containing protein [Chloroflexota bacterium]|jgi:predicted transcriptional regulator of viral defense system